MENIVEVSVVVIEVAKMENIVKIVEDSEEVIVDIKNDETLVKTITTDKNSKSSKQAA